MIPPVKLPRTGIEQVYTAERPRFIEAHREFERVASVNVSQALVHFRGEPSNFNRTFYWGMTVAVVY